MHRKNFKVITLLFATSLFFSSSLNTSAQEVNKTASYIDGDYSSGTEVVPSEKAQLLQAMNRSGMKSLIQDKWDIVNSTSSNPKFAKASTSYVAMSVTVPYCKQETGFYCGPATTRQTMLSLTKKADSQKIIAKALGTTSAGTDGVQIPKYLNEKQAKNYYVISSGGTEDETKRRINSSIANHTAPSIVRAKFSTGGDWEYNTDGHFMNISGYTKDMKKVYVTDPNIGNVISPTTGRYSVTFNEIYKAIMDHPKQHLYW